MTGIFLLSLGDFCCAEWCAPSRLLLPSGRLPSEPPLHSGVPLLAFCTLTGHTPPDNQNHKTFHRFRTLSPLPSPQILPFTLPAMEIYNLFILCKYASWKGREVECTFSVLWMSEQCVIPNAIFLKGGVLFGDLMKWSHLEVLGWQGKAGNSKPQTKGRYHGVVCSKLENSSAVGPGLGPSKDPWFWCRRTLVPHASLGTKVPGGRLGRQAPQAMNSARGPHKPVGSRSRR